MARRGGGVVIIMHGRSQKTVDAPVPYNAGADTGRSENTW